MENNKYINVGGVQIAESVYLKIRIEARNEALEEAFDIMEEVIRMGNGQDATEPLSLSVEQVRNLCDGAQFAATRYMKEYEDLIEELRQKKESIERDYYNRMEEAEEYCKTKKRNAETECYNMLCKAKEDAGNFNKKRLSEIEKERQEIKELREKCEQNFKESKEVLNAAYTERELAIHGINQKDYLVQIGRSKKDFKQIDMLAHDGKEAELKNKITELKRELKKARTGESNNETYRSTQSYIFQCKNAELRGELSWRDSILSSALSKSYEKKIRQDLSVGDEHELNVFTCLHISDIASAYFELASENIINNVTKVGLDESLRNLLELRNEVEWRMYGIEVTFNDDYIQKKLQLIKTVHALETYKTLRKEEIQAERERLREEARAQREYERELRKAEKDEETARRKIEEMQRKAEAEKHNAERYALYEKQIAELETALQTAVERQERAKSMAQQTRRGFVYVISNIGSFGDGVYKIGLTRRLDPQERVDELGDASVPFRFDVHAMIESEDAPALESALHQAFADRRVNKMNGRKEFFRVSLEEIEAEVRKSGIHANFRKEAYAKEYRDSVVI